MKSVIRVFQLSRDCVMRPNPQPLPSPKRFRDGQFKEKDLKTPSNSPFVRGRIHVAPRSPLLTKEGPGEVGENCPPLNLQSEEREPTSRVSLDFEIDSKWEEVSYLGGFCLLLKSRAIQQVGGLDESVSLNDALWQLYTRLRTSKYKLACAQEAYVRHAKLTNEEGANYDELTAAETEMNANAKQLYESGDVQGAERMFKRAIQMNPNFVEPYNNLAVLYWQEGQTGAALYKLTEALQVDANDVGAVVNYGLICKELEAPDIAQQIFEAFLQRNPDATEVRELLEN